MMTGADVNKALAFERTRKMVEVAKAHEMLELFPIFRDGPFLHRFYFLRVRLHLFTLNYKA